MLKSWQESTSTTQTNELSFYERIKQLSKNEKTRKTIIIDRIIGKRLDMFCEAEKVNKSDILHLALVDFLDKYET